MALAFALVVREARRRQRFFAMLVDEDFKHFGKPFTVTTEMMKAAGVDRKFKAEILRTFEEWGLIFLEPRANKNPQVSLRTRQGRGSNPFQNCR
jgi:hypothetical protein